MAEFKKAELKVVEQDVPKYDPSKSYKWEPTDKFILSGLEFDQIFKSLRALSQAPEFQQFLALQAGLKTVEEVFIQAVEAGVVVEMKETQEGQI